MILIFVCWLLYLALCRHGKSSDAVWQGVQTTRQFLLSQSEEEHTVNAEKKAEEPPPLKDADPGDGVEETTTSSTSKPTR